jgi:hypothetical protein
LAVKDQVARLNFGARRQIGLDLVREFPERADNQLLFEQESGPSLEPFLSDGRSGRGRASSGSRAIANAHNASGLPAFSQGFGMGRHNLSRSHKIPPDFQCVSNPKTRSSIATEAIEQLQHTCPLF